MSSSEVKRVSRQDIQLVQNLIERCLQLYMNQKEVVDTLLVQAKIEPGFTELVWQKLEEENREFFKAYYLRLIVKHQILEFNKLLEQQVQLMHQINPTRVAPIPTSNGSNIPPLHQSAACYAPDPTESALEPENTQNPVGSSLPNVFSNGGSSLPTTFSNNGSSLPATFTNGGSSLPNTFSNGSPSMQRSMHTAVEMPVHANRIGVTLNMPPNQNSNMGLMSGMNGEIKSEVGYSSNSSYMFAADGNVLETRPSLGNSSVPSYSSVESNGQPLNDALVDADSSSFGYLGQIPRNFSLSDLTADFSQSSDILESYTRSPFLETDPDNLMDPRERVEHEGDNRRLDTISEGLSYEYFGSE